MMVSIPGVGFLCRWNLFARPAAATFDFIDVERIEVLRGPQGNIVWKEHHIGRDRYHYA